MKYIIKKGHHFAFPMFTRPMRLDKKRAYEIIFSDECFDSYVEEKGAVNKLFGWTDGLALDSVHKNSRRLGWRANENKTITIIEYKYENGKLTKTEGLTIVKSTMICSRVGTKKGHFFGGFTHKYGWWLSPFFGGELPSPNNCTVTITRI